MRFFCLTFYFETIASFKVLQEYCGELPFTLEPDVSRECLFVVKGSKPGSKAIGVFLISLVSFNLEPFLSIPDLNDLATFKDYRSVIL